MSGPPPTPVAILPAFIDGNRGGLLLTEFELLFVPNGVHFSAATHRFQLAALADHSITPSGTHLGLPVGVTFAVTAFGACPREFYCKDHSKAVQFQEQLMVTKTRCGYQYSSSLGTPVCVIGAPVPAPLPVPALPSESPPGHAPELRSQGQRWRQKSSARVSSCTSMSPLLSTWSRVFCALAGDRFLWPHWFPRRIMMQS